MKPEPTALFTEVTGPGCLAHHPPQCHVQELTAARPLLREHRVSGLPAHQQRLVSKQVLEDGRERGGVAEETAIAAPVVGETRGAPPAGVGLGPVRRRRHPREGEGGQSVARRVSRGHLVARAQLEARVPGLDGQGGEDVIADVTGVVLARSRLDRLLQEPVGEVGIAVFRPRGVVELGVLSEDGAELFVAIEGLAFEREPVQRHRVGHPRSLGQERADRDAAPVGVRRVIGVERPVQLQFPRLHELHRRDGGDDLRRRIGHLESGALHREACGDVAHAGGCLEEDAVAGHDEVLNAGHLAPLHHPVEVGLHRARRGGGEGRVGAGRREEERQASDARSETHTGPSFLLAFR